MEDSRVFGSKSFGVLCYSDMYATRCTIEGSGSSGVFVSGAQNSAELVDCVIRKNGSSGIYLSSGTVSENKMCGVAAYNGGKVTVAKAEEGKPQTVCKDNAGTDWYTLGDSGEIIGIPQEKLNA